MAQLLSIAIEDTEIKLLVVDGRQVKTAAIMPLEPGLVKDGVVLDKSAVSQKIRQLLEAERVGPRRAIVSVSGIHSIFQIISLPRMSAELLAEAVKREAERIMPVPMSEINLSWQSVAVTGDETTICILGSPKRSVDALIDTLHEAGIDPYIMDSRPLAAARLCGEARAMAINVEANDFDIVVIVNGIPELVRSLAFSRDELLPHEKIAEVKEELERTVRFYNAGHEAAPIAEDVPVIMGGKAELTRFLRGELTYPVRELAVPLSYPPTFDSGEFATNIGLVLKEMRIEESPLRLNLNTVPAIYLPKPVPVFPIISWLLIILTVCVLVWFGFSTRNTISEVSALRVEMNQAQEEMKTRQIDPGKITELEANLAAVTATKDNVRQVLIGLEQHRVKVSSDLGQAVSLIPANVTLNTLGHGGVMVIEGMAPDGAIVLSYAKSLRDSGRFSEVLIAFSTDANNQVSFTLTCW